MKFELSLEHKQFLAEELQKSIALKFKILEPLKETDHKLISKDKKLFPWAEEEMYYEAKKKFNFDDEWVKEPDYLKWKDKSTGLKCIIKRGPVLALNGYVEFKPKIDFDIEECDLEVHGGITFSDKTQDGTYILGFDCAHHFDLLPFIHLHSTTLGEKYRNVAYVKEQCESLAKRIYEEYVKE